ncbi:ectoine/hydroxyectoine ABC transporter substrate-binding protein EhuB [Lentibacillus sp. L22]|uniref:ectoine/hydroxyectoine ABC transporter substrate-binding protein EhuB n=1 Tax=Lentibacillus TaxID=175304 RepID=UPI0022B0DB6C|nr:ectoine/hydroxyectoine ABC transporter substrate-binding protein EhuB [Lentibacillus daqui]
MKKTLFMPILCFVLVMLAACGSDNASGESDGDGNLLEKLKEKGTVTVGFANEKPYAYQDDSGELKGAAVDIATAVFKELGVDNVEGQLADYSQLIPGLNAGKFEVITAGMAITPERCENADFGEPEMMYGEGLIVQKGNPLDLHSYKDLADKDATVSIMSGATENDFVTKEGVDKKQIQSAPDIPATFSAVESGRADATTGTEMTIKMAFESSDSNKLEFVEDFEQPEDIEGVPSYGAAAFKKGNDKLREAYNEKLAELKDSGKVAELLEKNGFSGETNSAPDDITAESVCSGENY